MKFEWHWAKAAANFRKHSVSFDEAATVFADPLSYVYPDPDHSEDETRFLLIGISEAGRMLVISHTDRGEQTRIISARLATRKERSFYEEESKR
jgi:uncharacterized DUF497 family protein